MQDIIQRSTRHHNWIQDPVPLFFVFVSKSLSGRVGLDGQARKDLTAKDSNINYELLRE